MCIARPYSQGVDLFALNFYLDRVVPISHSWHQKTRDNGLGDGKDRIPPHSLVLTQYRSLTDRPMDRQMDMLPVAYTAHAIIITQCYRIYGQSTLTRQAAT